MPYSTTSELPSSVRSKYSSKCQRAFMHAFNSVHERTGDEGRAMAAGHSAAQQCEGKSMDNVTYTSSTGTTSYLLDVNEFEPVTHPVTFKMFTGVLKAYRDSDNKMRLKGVASSTIKDRHGDEMKRSAIDDMVRAANNNLTIFLNHSYEVPEDVAGSVTNARAVLAGTNNDGSEIWDLDYDVIVNEANPRAVSAWQAIDGGTRLGLSIGAMIPEGGATRNKKSGAYSFDHVELLETSIVGIPANPRSWIQSAVKAIKSLDKAERFDSPIGEITIVETETTGESSIEVAMAATCGADCPGGTCKRPKGHSGDHMANYSETPSAIKSDEDDVVTGEDQGEPAPVEIHSTDPSPDGDSSQEASASDPETEPASSEPAAEDAATKALTVQSLVVLERTVNELMETKRLLSDARLEVEKAYRERDEAVILTYEVLRKTSTILDRMANLPLGRKAVVREINEDYSAIERIYGPEMLKQITAR